MPCTLVDVKECFRELTSAKATVTQKQRGKFCNNILNTPNKNNRPDAGNGVGVRNTGVYKSYEVAVCPRKLH
jgi:hypothetical protein